VVNPTNPLDRFHLPQWKQSCEDQDPTCDFNSTPGRCSFEVVVCVNNIDPRLPGCAGNGISSYEVLPPRLRLHTPANIALAASAQTQVTTALTQLLDPQNPGSGYTHTPPTGTQNGFCSGPIAMNIEVLSGAARRQETTVAALTLRVRSKDGTLPKPRKVLSRLRLSCKARPLP
jgi:hypothetical protein